MTKIIKITLLILIAGLLISCTDFDINRSEWGDDTTQPTRVIPLEGTRMIDIIADGKFEDMLTAAPVVE